MELAERFPLQLKVIRGQQILFAKEGVEGAPDVGHQVGLQLRHCEHRVQQSNEKDMVLFWELEPVEPKVFVQSRHPHHNSWPELPQSYGASKVLFDFSEPSYRFLV